MHEERTPLGPVGHANAIPGGNEQYGYTSMTQTFATVWLSRLALVAVAVFLYSAWRVWSLDPESRANRIAVVFNLVFAIWAFGASLWYMAQEEPAATSLYRFFSWTFCFFPPLILHFTLRVTGQALVDSRWKLPALTLLYAPAVALALAIPGQVIAPSVHRAGYWMLAVRTNAVYYAFVVHYFSYVLAAVVLSFRASARSAELRSRKRFAIIGASFLSAGLLGFVTDSVFLVLGIEFPNLAILWIVIISLGLNLAMDRYGFSSVLPAREAVAVLEQMAGFVIYLDSGGRLVWANSSALSALGMTLDGARGSHVSAFLPPDLSSMVLDKAQETEDQGESLSVLGKRRIPVSVKLRRVYKGWGPGTVITAADLRAENERACVERRLADSSLVLDEFVNRSMDGIVLTDTMGHIAQWNDAMAAITGVPRDEAEGSYYWDLILSLWPLGRERPELLRERFQAILAGKYDDWSHRQSDVEIVRRDGSHRILQTDVSPIPTTEGVILALIARDLTDERRIAAENIERIRHLDHAQKMEAVGALSGGIAHDFNNTLAGIVGAMSLIRQRMEGGAQVNVTELTRELEIIERSANRASSSVKRLLTLTRKRAPESAPFRVDEALARVADFAERSVDSSVRVRLESAMPALTVLGSVGQVEQLILNLVVNAEHAMTVMQPAGHKWGGNLRLGLRRFRPDRSFLAVNAAAADIDYCEISIKDEGVGIPRHIQRRIFDPFYTTKPGETSSGLGLAMVHAIASQHGGFVRVRSDVDLGSEFLVYLPLSKDSGGGVMDAQKPASRHGLVLIADDDDIPREIAEAVARTLGYDTAVASSGMEALSLFMARQDAFKAAVLDLRLRDMRGDEVAAAIRRVRGDMPIVLASGFHEDNLCDLPGTGGCALVDKPFTVVELDEALRKAGTDS